MLILAGVSLNAIIGDNGIITRAQEANVQNSIAMLEEYLQLKYTENYERMAQYQSKIEGLTNVFSDYFYIPSQEGVGGLRYVIDSEEHALYLIKKSGLPEEIKESLIGGEAGEGTYTDYQNLNDVYGVTSNLKVYYCSGGVDSIDGLAKENLDKDNPSRKVIDGDEDIFENLKKFDKNGDGELSSSEVLSITDLELDSTMDSNNIDNLYRFTSLRNLILKDFILDDFNGIRNCGNLTSLYLQNCVFKDYSSIGNLNKKLNKLYFYNIDDAELEKICANNTGIGEVDFYNLEYLGFFGNKDFLNLSVRGIYESNYSKGTSSKSITNIVKLKNLSILTKEKVKYLYLNNNKIVNLEGIEGFTNLYLLRVETNCLESLANLENINLTYLHVANNKLGINESFKGDVDINNQYSDKDALKALENNKNLNYLNIMDNPEIKYVKYLSNLSTVRYFYGLGLLKIADANNLIYIKNISSPNFTLDSKYELDLLDEKLTTSLDLRSKELTLSNLESIKKCTNIYRLNLDNTTYVDNVGQSVGAETINEKLVECLSSLNKMQYLSLKNISALTSINFVDKQAELIQILLDGTHINDLSALEKCEKIKHISINYLNSSSTLTASTIKRCVGLKARDWPLWNNKDAWVRSMGISLNSKGCFDNITWPEDLEYFSCMGNLSSDGDIIDLSDCTNIKEVNNYDGNKLRINANKLSYVMIKGDTLEFQGSGNFVKVYIDGCYDTSFFSKWTNFNNIYFDCITGDLSWMKNAESRFKTSVTGLYSQGSVPVKNLNLGDLSEYVNLVFLHISDSTKTIFMGDISSLNSLTDIEFYSITITNLQNLPLTNIKRLSLINCGISSIYYLQNCTLLEYLNLNQNPLQELSYDDSGNSIRSVQILASLRNNSNLKSLYIEGNMFADLQELRSLNWEGKSGF